MKSILLILLIFKSFDFYGQLNVPIANLPDEIQTLLFQNKLRMNWVDSVQLEEIDSDRMKSWLDTSGMKNLSYHVYYSIASVSAEIFICQYDGAFYISEYDYLLWNSIFESSNNYTKISNDKIKEKLKVEIKANCIGVKNIHFEDEFGQQLNDGYYDDKILRVKKNPLSLRLSLFSGRDLTNLVSSYNKLIGFNEIQADYFDYSTYLCLYGRHSNPTKKGKKDLSFERYRRILFDPIHFSIESDGIISPVVKLIYCP